MSRGVVRVRLVVCDVEVMLSFYNRVCGLDSRFYFLNHR